MAYDLGIDVGVTTTSAAACLDAATDADRVPGAPGGTAIVPLGSVSASMAAAVHLHRDGALSTGDAAARANATDPAGGVRHLRRRLGDPAPILLRTEPYGVERLYGALLASVVDTATERFGQRPRRVAVSHPGGWGPYLLDALRAALGAAGLHDAVAVPEAVAAAAGCRQAWDLPAGAALAVYDLGGTTLDAAVVWRSATGFEPLGEPVTIDGLGGQDVDELILQHVRGAVGERWPTDPGDPSLPAPMLQLRRAHRWREALDTRQSVDRRSCRACLRRWRCTATSSRRWPPRLHDGVEALVRVVRSAGLRPDELAAVLPVGGAAPWARCGPRWPSAWGRSRSSTPAHPCGGRRSRPGGPGGGRPAKPPLPACPPAAAPALTSSRPTVATAAPGSAPHRFAGARRRTSVSPAAATSAAAPPMTAPIATPGSSPSVLWPPTAHGLDPAPPGAGWAVVLSRPGAAGRGRPYKMLRGTPSGDGGGGGTTVGMAGTRFSPGVLTVPKGTTVLFQNDDVQAHTVTATADNIDPNIDSGIVEAGGAFTLTVEERFVYFCAIHPSMTGTIEIGA
ncbi:MAG: hypothetical protein R2749_14525 [Acidimicrobiales bacterium]